MNEVLTFFFAPVGRLAEYLISKTLEPLGKWAERKFGL